MATIAEVKAQRDAVSAAVDAWEVSANQASQDATTAASASAVSQTAQQAAADSAALAAQKKQAAQAEAQKLADLIGEPSPPEAKARKR
jgi:hypothetical protein